MANASLKEEKQKIAKVKGVIEKKSEKKSSTKSTLNGRSEWRPETRSKTESKAKPESLPEFEFKTKSESEIRSETKLKIKSKSNGKSMQKVPKNDRATEQKQSSSTDKRLHLVEKQSSSTEIFEGKRSIKEISSKSKDSIRSKVVKKDKSIAVKSVSKRQSMPLKASHAIGAKSNAATTITSKNVMNQVHNVTISSPPPARREIGASETAQLTEQTVIEYEQIQRKKHKEQQIQQKQLQKRQQKDRMEIEQKHEDTEQPREQLEQEKKAKQNGQQTDESESFPKRGRTRTRTLEENEIVLLKPKTTSNLVLASNGSEPQSLVSEYSPVEIKPPISFEVILNEVKHANHTNKSPVKAHDPVQSVIPVTVNGNDASDNEPHDYEDDFESYESDFESEIEEEDDESDEGDEESEEDTTISSGESDTDDNLVSTASRHPFETGHSIENSEFDSGSFELKILSSRTRNCSEQPAASHREQNEVQNDSGIENFSNTVNALIQNGQLNSLDLNNKTFDNISDIENEGVNSLDTVNKLNSGKTEKKSRLAKRGEELLRKITLDVMNYVLFDSKPIPYEVFMKIYGNTNTAQVAAQTHNDRIDQECQNDVIAMQTIWSQCPISFYTEHINRSDFNDYKNGCGIVVEQINENTMEKLYENGENSLNLIRNLTIKSITNDETNDENDGQIIANIDYEKLNRFLLESEITMSRILNFHTQKRTRKLNEAILPISNGFHTLNVNINGVDKQINQTFAINALPGFFFTLHRDIDTDLNLITMWNLTSLHSPVCVLSVWSKVLCLEVHPKIKDIVFAGLNDG